MTPDPIDHTRKASLDARHAFENHIVTCSECDLNVLCPEGSKLNSSLLRARAQTLVVLRAFFDNPAEL